MIFVFKITKIQKLTIFLFKLIKFALHEKNENKTNIDLIEQFD